ncbi:hypothetical protein [Sphingomonas sp. NIBR02145]|uniref:hypothetical protein n=1 Tax=Sphingomonas sp. NIBR02145 TaxID=3014784 RepID=UPI0022B46010|nr:hypothetical protein [Sphingomonas sp. NIBR02145]WHU04728.1 hypothetical protein O3305_09110 [Sphingomonas sp. NIBR02145]
MSPLSPLLVLVVREAGLRSTLIARLSMAGADLVTIDNIDDPRIQRWLAKGPVLILDQAALQAREGGEAALRADPRWRAIAVIGGAAENLAYPPRIPATDAATEIEAMLPGWGYPER